MAEDSPNTTLEEPTEDLGEQLVQRATAPGVIRRDLAARIRRSCCVAETGLASEIQRRFAPAASADPWGQGPALPHAGFGGFGAAASGSPMPGVPAVQAKASPAPVARTVGAAAASPAAQSLSALGSSLQRRHLGATQSGAEMVQRRALPGSPPTPALSTPASASTSAPIQRSSIPTPAAGVGPAIVQRSTGSSAAAPDLPLRRMSEPEEVEEKPGPPSPAPPVQAQVARKEMGPAIVHRSVAKEIGPAIVQRSAGGPAGSPAAAPDLPLRRMSEPEEEEKPAAQSPEMPAVQAQVARKEMGPAIVHRSSGRAVVDRASAAPASAAPAPSQAPVLAPVQRAAAPASPVSLASPVLPGTSSGAVLPLVQAARPAGRGDEASGIVQAQRATGMVLSAPAQAPAPAPTAGLSATAAGLTLPLARSVQPAGGGGGAAGGGVVQRQAGGDSGMASPAAEPIGGADAGASAPAAPGGTTAAGALDLDDVVEHVMRRLTRSLAVENERHGGRRWP